MTATIMMVGANVGGGVGGGGSEGGGSSGETGGETPGDGGPLGLSLEFIGETGLELGAVIMGGNDPFTYGWSVITGDATISGSSTSSSCVFVLGSDPTSTVQCDVTDDDATSVFATAEIPQS